MHVLCETRSRLRRLGDVYPQRMPDVAAKLLLSYIKLCPDVLRLAFIVCSEARCHSSFGKMLTSTSSSTSVHNMFRSANRLHGHYFHPSELLFWRNGVLFQHGLTGKYGRKDDKATDAKARELDDNDYIHGTSFQVYARQR
jgi:hypothetical protein